MSEVQDFNQLVNLAMSDQKLLLMRPVVTKELLHYDILFALENEGLLDDLTFQGGTSLRLCYGAQRYSEDLDFVAGSEFSTEKVKGIKKCIEKYIGQRYGLEVSVKEPKDLAAESEYTGVKVDKWQVSIITSPEKKDLPRQKIKLEIVNVPAYSRIPQSVKQNYNFLPDGYEDMLIMTETLDEIMADKLIALPNCQRYIRYRDIWDLRWLKQHGANINMEFVRAKIQDYEVENYLEKLETVIKNLEKIVHSKEFMAEMARFIPIDVQERTLKKSKFLEFLFNENKNILLKVKDSLR